MLKKISGFKVIFGFDSAEYRVRDASDKISQPFSRERTVSSLPCLSQHDSFILVSVLFLDTGALNLTLHLRSSSVYFHPFRTRTVDETKRIKKREKRHERALGRGSTGEPDRGWTEKRIEHERSRESGRVTALEVDEAVTYGQRWARYSRVRQKHLCSMLALYYIIIISFKKIKNYLIFLQYVNLGS